MNSAGEGSGGMSGNTGIMLSQPPPQYMGAPQAQTHDHGFGHVVQPMQGMMTHQPDTTRTVQPAPNPINVEHLLALQNLV